MLKVDLKARGKSVVGFFSERPVTLSGRIVILKFWPRQHRHISARLLITSANFSPAAWGKPNREGELVIENFELGVCIEQAAWPLTALEPFADMTGVATISTLPPRGTALITWAQASWDG